MPSVDIRVVKIAGRGLTREEKNDRLKRIKKECQWFAQDPS
jgi:hypothetical protein